MISGSGIDFIIEDDIDTVADSIFGIKDSLFVTEPQYAMFYYFKESGKYYTHGRGLIPPFNDIWTRKELLEVNGGKMPGLSTTGSDKRIVVIPEPETVYGWPQIKEIEN